MSREIDKAFLKHYDDNGFGHKSSEEVRIAKLAFAAGYHAAQQAIQPDALACEKCGVSEMYENGFCWECLNG